MCAIMVVVIAGTYDGGLIGFEVKDKSSLVPLFGFSAHLGAVKCMASSGEFVVTGSSDETIKIFSSRALLEVGRLHRPVGRSVTCLDMLQDSFLLSGSEDGGICLWRTKDWELLKEFSGAHSRAVQKVDSGTPKSIISCTPTSSNVIAAKFHPTGRVALSVGFDRLLKLWDLTKGVCAVTKELAEAPSDVCWAPIGTLYALLFQKEVVIFSATSSASCSIVSAATQRFSSANFVSDDVLVVADSAGGFDLYICKEETEGKLTALRLTGQTGSSKQHNARIKGVAPLPSSRQFVTADSDGLLCMWSLEEEGSVLTLLCSSATNCRITCLAASH